MGGGGGLWMGSNKQPIIKTDVWYPLRGMRYQASVLIIGCLLLPLRIVCVSTADQGKFFRIIVSGKGQGREQLLQDRHVPCIAAIVHVTVS